MTQAKKQDDTRLNLASHDAVGERIEQLKALLPEIFVEGQIDPERLRQHLGDFSKVGAERYGLNWAGKADAIRSLQIASHGTLVPMKDQSVNFDESENMIIEGDNLEVLKLLQKSYHGKIKMIYIDPPYNTGGDFIYPDNFKEGLDTYLRYSGQATEEGFKVSTNSESSGRYHSSWLNMMFPRLFLAKNLLKDDGIIFVSISEIELHNLTSMMSEIYGEENFLAILSRRTKSGGGAAAHHFAIDNDFVVVYARNKKELKHLFVPHDETYLKRYSEEDDDGKYFWDTMERTYTQTTPYIITAPDGSKLKGNWFRSEERFLDDQKKGEIRFVQKPDKSWSVQFKQRLSDGKKIRSLLHEKEFRSTQDDLEAIKMKEFFDFPKPVFLLKHLLAGAAGKDGIVLDFFAGSGTTAEAVIRQNLEDGGARKFICVQLPEPTEDGSVARKAGLNTIAEITRERVRRVGTSISSTLLNNVDYGFKAFGLSSSNFKLWDASAGSKDADGLAKQLELYADNLLPGRSQDDILYEVILKAGQPLTAKIEKIEVAGQQVFSIGGAMLICLEDPIKEETLVGMLEYQPAIMVTLDKAFHGNDQLKTNIKLQAEATGESEQSRVLFKTV